MDGRLQQDEVVQLMCNVDDMGGDAVSAALEALMAAGALDACAVPILMKKGRPAWQFQVLCRPAQEEGMALCLLQNTTSIGVRTSRCGRWLLARQEGQRETVYGPVRTKLSQGPGIRREKMEYEDAARLARENGVPLRALAEQEEKGRST